MKKHKWHDVIVAYLAGKEIEYHSIHTGSWVIVSPFECRVSFPDFSEPNSKWRIAPIKIKIKANKYKKVLVGNDPINSYYITLIYNEGILESLRAIYKVVQVLSVDWIEEEVEIELQP